MSDIGFGGPSGEYKPSLGDNSSVPYVSGTMNPISAADPQAALASIDALLALIDVLTSDLEDTMSTFALPVTDSPVDAKLKAAHLSEWPIDLGEPKNYITYRYYKSLELRDTAAAVYMRQCYLNAAQDITGNNAIDLIPLVNIIDQEALLAQEFISQNVISLSDSSEYRAVENVQDWITAAFGHTGALRSIFQAGSASVQLPDSDVNSLDSQSASNAQALFKVNLNKLNSDLNQATGTLQKSFFHYAGTFYNNFLTPALNFRQNVTSQLTPIYPGVLGQEMIAAHNATDNNLANLLADQLRRNNMFEQIMITIENTISMRDQYRSYIQQLSTLGTTVSTGGAGTLILATDTPDEASFFTAPIQAATPNFASSHSSLVGLSDPAAHNQYFLKAGDTLSGNLILGDSALVDGIVPSTHVHTGVDGSARIHGGDIIPGSISPDAIDTSSPPAMPQDLRIISITAGPSVVTVLLAWEGDPGLIYEVQYAPV